VVVRVLPRNVEQLARLAAARAEVAVVEQQRAESRFAKSLGIRGQSQLARRGESVRHDDDRMRSLAFRLIQPRGDLLAAGREADVGALHPRVITASPASPKLCSTPCSSRCPNAWQ